MYSPSLVRLYLLILNVAATMLLVSAIGDPVQSGVVSLATILAIIQETRRVCEARKSESTFGECELGMCCLKRGGNFKKYKTASL